MAITKYASFEVSEILDVKGTETQARTASLDKVSDFHDFRTKDGYLYARIRAISSRVNKNNDGWPSIELAGGQETWDKLSAVRESSGGGFTVEADAKQKYGYSTFVGKPIFVDHHNTDPSRARGVIVDAKFHVEDHKTAAELDPYYADAPEEHTPPAWVELLLEVDAKSFPKLAKAIIEGSEDDKKGIDGFSMGCDVEKSVCSICKNAATSPDEYCNHVKIKGAHFDHYDEKTGKKTSKKAYEDCYGIGFFEISAVFDPADETALTREVIKEGSVKEGSPLGNRTAKIEGSPLGHRLADNPKPQSELTKAPEEVNTLREEKVCPVCGSTIDDVKCEVCGYQEPPDGLNNPDLQKAKEAEPEGLEGEDPLGEEAPEEALEGAPPEDTSPLRARKEVATSSVTSEMTWVPEITPRLAAVLAKETQTDEPKEQVIKDEPRPTTARTANDLIEAAERNQENDMTDVNKVAAEPADPSAKADKQVDVTGVGGVADATNEQASKAEAQVDVEGKGGTGVEGVDADEHQSVEQTADDNAGFDTKKNTDDSGPTKTFDNSNEPDSAVTDKAFPTSAKQGTDPIDPVGKPDERVDVEAEVPVDWQQSQTGTDQWTGTDGNGVTKQQDPVTRVTTPNTSSHRASMLLAFKLADKEAKMGLITEDEKYDRIAQLERKSEEVVGELIAYLESVKTAGLRRQAATTQAHRVPSLRQAAVVEEVVTPEPETQLREDSALFS